MNGRRQWNPLSTRSRAVGFTLVELLVVIAIIGILVALLLPAVQAVREAARRSQCQNNLVQLIVAVNHYEMAHSAYPPGTIEPKGPIRNIPQGYHHGWITQILPYMEQRNTYQHIDRSVGVYGKKNVPVRDLSIEVLNCSSSPTFRPGYTTYAGVHNDLEAPIDVNNNGVFFLNSRIRYDDVLDGTSQTAFIGEKLTLAGDLGWMSGTNATLRNMGLVPIGTRPAGGSVWPTAPPSEMEAPAMGGVGMAGGMSMGGGAAGISESTPGAETPKTDATATPPTDNVPAAEADASKGALSEPAAGTDPATAAPATAAPATAAPATAAQLFVGSFGSFHPGVVGFAFGDGSVRTISNTISAGVYQQLGHRADGKLLDGESY